MNRQASLAGRIGLGVVAILMGVVLLVAGDPLAPAGALPVPGWVVAGACVVLGAWLIVAALRARPPRER